MFEVLIEVNNISNIYAILASSLPHSILLLSNCWVQFASISKLASTLKEQSECVCANIFALTCNELF